MSLHARFVSDIPEETHGVRFMLGKYAYQAHVDNFTPHDLRHRFGYRMAEHVPLHRLAQIMGHDSLDTTLIYIRGTRVTFSKPSRQSFGSER